MSQPTSQNLFSEGNNVLLTVGALTSGGDLTLSWTLPAPAVAYAGAIVLLSESLFTSDNFPVDGTKYSPSTNWSAPADTIGSAHVVSAFYGFFGDDTTQTTVTVTGLDPTKIYYGSIHICSNILQYYTPGSQSYPLEANEPIKGNSAFASSISTRSSPPSNPKPNQVYFDIGSSTVLSWNESQLAWIKSNQNTVQTDFAPFIDVALLYYNIPSNNLKFFDGVEWVIADNTNLRVKAGVVWLPFVTISETGTYPTPATPGQFVYLNLPPDMSAPGVSNLKFYSLGQWFNPTPDIVQVLINSTWTNIAVPDAQNMGYTDDPLIPAVGDFFFNKSTRLLLMWTGSTGWVPVEDEDKGPTYDRVNVGTDGTQATRTKAIQDLMTRLGYPAVCLDIQPYQFELAINNALTMLRSQTDSAYEHSYISYTLYGGASGGQNTYYLNDPRDGTDRIVDVIKIHRISQLGISSLSAETGLFAQAFFNQLFQGNNVDIVSIHLVNQLSAQYEKIFAGNIMFVWDEAKRELNVLRRLVQTSERVILEVMLEKTEQELLVGRYTRQWLQDWAYAECLEMLANVRGKYQSLPGPNGPITLNSAECAALAASIKLDCRRQIMDYELGNGTPSGNFSILRG